MKTGIVLELNDGKASLIMPGGRFKTVPAGKNWQTGDIVTLQSKAKNYIWTITSAACICLLVSLSLFGYGTFFRQSTLISIDVNPSIEIQLNSLDRVTKVTALNRDAGEIIEQSSLKNKKLSDALTLLFEEGLDSYLSDDAYITFTILSKNKNKESLLLDELQLTTDSYISSHNQTAQIEAYAVDEQTVQAAHSHHLTAGKYNALRQLLEVFPQADMKEYSHCSIGEIKAEIRHHSGSADNPANTQDNAVNQSGTGGQDGCHRHSGSEPSHD